MKLSTILAYVWIIFLILIFVIYAIMAWPDSKIYLVLIGFIMAFLATFLSIVKISFHICGVD